MEVLRDLNYFTDVDQLIDYIKYPSKRDKVFIAWTEYGSPIVEGTKTWDMFVNTIMNMKQEEIGDGKSDQRKET